MALESVAGRTSQETSHTHFYQAIVSSDNVIFKVFHMPKSEKQWDIFEKYMRLLHQDTEKVKRIGLKLEEQREREEVDPDRLLFALRIDLG